MRNYSFSSTKRFTKGGESAMCLGSFSSDLLWLATNLPSNSTSKSHLSPWECSRIKWFSEQIHNLLLPWMYLIADPRSVRIRDTVVLSSPRFITEMIRASGAPGNWPQATDHRRLIMDGRCPWRQALLKIFLLVLQHRCPMKVGSSSLKDLFHSLRSLHSWEHFKVCRESRGYFVCWLLQ